MSAAKSTTRVLVAPGDDDGFVGPRDNCLLMPLPNFPENGEDGDGEDRDGDNVPGLAVFRMSFPPRRRAILATSVRMFARDPAVLIGQVICWKKKRKTNFC